MQTRNVNINTSSTLNKQSKILALQNKAPSPSDGHQNHTRVIYSSHNSNNNNNVINKNISRRHIASKPERVLDAPEVVDDYYINLLDWSATNKIAVALGTQVFVLNGEQGSIQSINNNSNNLITSVAWMNDGNYLAVGNDKSEVQLWDVNVVRQLRSMKGHNTGSRVGALSWNNCVLSSGGSDSHIINHDVRVANHKLSVFDNHSQEVCGLKWSCDGKFLASGGNDNLLNIWSSSELNSTTPKPKFVFDQHQAAVKALAWCPWAGNTGVLASGGGTADRQIKIWDCETGRGLDSLDTGSQVCALEWSKHQKELISTHGYARNEVCVWKYPSMAKTAELVGHSARVLHMSGSPDGTTIATLAADESLRFWRLSDHPNSISASSGKVQQAKQQSSYSSASWGESVNPLVATKRPSAVKKPSSSAVARLR